MTLRIKLASRHADVTGITAADVRRIESNDEQRRIIKQLAEAGHDDVVLAAVNGARDAMQAQMRGRATP